MRLKTSFNQQGISLRKALILITLHTSQLSSKSACILLDTLFSCSISSKPMCIYTAPKKIQNNGSLLEQSIILQHLL